MVKKKRRIISIMLMAAMLITLLPMLPGNSTGTASAETSISIGDYVQMGTYYGKPILWRCADIDENGPLMLSDKILCIKAFDAGGKNISGSHGRGCTYKTTTKGYYRQLNGSNYWEDSNIRCWLNSNESAGNVTWTCGNPPDESHVRSKSNAYDQEAGFLTNFSAGELNAMKTVNQDSLLYQYEYENMSSYGSMYHIRETDIENVVQNAKTTAYKEQVTDTMFLLDVNQIHQVYENSSILGTGYYIGEPTAECVSNSDYTSSDLAAGKKWTTWLRSPNAADNYDNNVRYVSNAGSVSSGPAYDDYTGVRPAFYLNLQYSIFKSGTGTEADPYIPADYVYCDTVNIVTPATASAIVAVYSGDKLKETSVKTVYLNTGDNTVQWALNAPIEADETVKVFAIDAEKKTPLINVINR